MRWESCPRWFANGRKQLQGIHGRSGLLGVIRKMEKGKEGGGERQIESGRKGGGRVLGHGKQ